MYEQPDERLNYVAKSYSSSAILKHLKAGTECACSAVFETCRFCEETLREARKRTKKKERSLEK